MAVPVLVAVDDDPRSLLDVERELLDRYARSCRVVCVASAEEAIAKLEALAAAGEEVALVLAAQSLGGTTGSELLGVVRALCRRSLARGAGGFIRTGADVEGDASWPLARSPFALETSMPGVFAAGDLRHGSMNRVASAVGEGSIAIKLVHELFEAEQLHQGDRI